MALTKKFSPSSTIMKHLLILVMLGFLLYFMFNVSLVKQEKRWSNSNESEVQSCEGANSKVQEGINEEDEERIEGCEGRYMYVYELPREWNEDLVDKCGRVGGNWVPMCGNLENNGYGPLLVNNKNNSNNNNNGSNNKSSYSSHGSSSSSAKDSHGNGNGDVELDIVLEPPHAWFQTEQFSAEVIFHQRLLGSYPCLTPHPSLAHLFYIPFYAGLDSAFTLFTPHLHLRDRLTQRLLGWLSGNPVWIRYKDTKKHFIVLGRTTWDFSRIAEGSDGWGTSLLAQPELAHVTKLLIEKKPLGNGEIGIPYPTSFHPSSVQDLEIWQRKLKTSKRKLLCSFIGATWRGTPSSQALRKELSKQCEKVGDNKCLQARCGSDTSSPNTIDCIKHPEHVTALFLRTTFCLQPPGDSPTRKGLFDSLIAGCIPVFFSTLSAYEQYTWHLPRNGSLYSVFFDANDVANGQIDIMATLTHIANDIPRLRRMQQEVVSMLPHLVYALSHQNITDTAFQDVVDVAIHNLLQSAPLK